MTLLSEIGMIIDNTIAAAAGTKYTTIAAIQSEKTANTLLQGIYLITGSGNGLTITVSGNGSSATLSGSGEYATKAALTSDSATGNLPPGSYLTLDQGLYTWANGVLTAVSSSPNITNIVNLTGNVSLSSAVAAGTQYVNSSANNYTITLAAAGIGGLSIKNTGSGSVTIATPAENLLPKSNGFSNSNWTNNGLTITDSASGQVSPIDGAAFVSKLLTASGGGSVYTAADIPTNGVYYTASVWIKGDASSIGYKGSLYCYNNGIGQVKKFTVTSSWQLVTLGFAPNGGQYYSVTLGLYTLPASSFLYASDICIQKGQYKTPARTAGTATGISATNIAGQLTTPVYPLTTPPELIANSTIQRLDINEQSSGSYLVRPNLVNDIPVFPSNDSSFLLIRSGYNRDVDIVLAACDSKNPYASDYIMSGSNDQTVLSSAIATLSGLGGKVKLKQGTFVLSDTINWNATAVTLEGACRPYYGRFQGPFDTGARTDQGMPGGSKLLQTTVGKNIITVGAAANSPNGLVFGGISLRDLYFVGANGSGTGVFDAGNSDISEIVGCNFTDLYDGINVAWDTGNFMRNSIQNIYGRGIIIGGGSNTGGFGTIQNNIIYDSGGCAILLLGWGGTSISTNTIGSCGGGYFIATKANDISGGTVQGMVSTATGTLYLNGSLTVDASGTISSLGGLPVIPGMQVVVTGTGNIPAGTYYVSIYALTDKTFRLYSTLAGALGSGSGGITTTPGNLSGLTLSIGTTVPANPVEIAGANAINNAVAGLTMSVDNVVGLATYANTVANGVYIHGGAKQNTVSGNTIKNTTATASGSAVNMDSSANYNSITGNVFTGGKWAGTAGITDSGTGNSKTGNVNI